MKKNNLKLSNFLLIIFLAAGIVIRLINIRAPLLEFFPERQTQTAEITRNIYKNGWSDFWTAKVRYFTNGEPIPYVLEFPTYNGLVAVLYHLFGPNVIWGRIASLTFFLGSSIVFYKLLFRTDPDFSPEKSAGTPEPRPRALATHGRRPWEQVSVVLGSLLFFIFSPLHILISRSFQPEELALFLLLLAVYKKSWLIFSLAVLTKLPIALFAPVLIYQQLRNQNSTVILGLTRNLYKISAKMFASLAPSLAWYFRASRLTVHPAIAQNFNLSNWFQPALWLNPKWYFSLFQIEQIWVLTTLGLFFFWIGFWKLAASLRGSPSASRGNLTFWLVWLASGLLYFLIFNYHAMTHEYYHLFLLPPLSVFVAAGLKKILDTVKPLTLNFRLITISGILLLFILGLIQPAIKKIISAPKSPQESTEITPVRYQLIEDF